MITSCAVLLAVVAGAPAQAAAASGCRPSVRALQHRLTSLGYPVGRIDGCDGPGTRAAVMALQRTHGLASDGIAGPAVRRALARPVPVISAWARGGSRMEVDLRRQVMLEIRSGRVVRVYAVSTGAPGFSTPAGRFRVQRKEQRSWSTQYEVWLPWASYFHNGVAVHAGDVSRVRASHGCVRVAAPLAARVYAAMHQGSAIVVR